MRAREFIFENNDDGESGNYLIDFDGPALIKDFVRRFERNELVHTGGQISSVRPIQDKDLPDALRNTALAQKLAELIK